MNRGESGQTVRIGRARASSRRPCPAALLRFHPLGAPPSFHHHALLEGWALIGRGTDCDVSLDDEGVSRHHARLAREASGWRITDLDSTNGVRVNGAAVPDYLLRGGEIIRLGSTLLRFLGEGFTETSEPLEVRCADLVCGPRLRPLLETLERVAGSGLTVLITGETGTGKELAAQCLHRSGPHREQPFVAVNCAALPRELAESELFGHVKGSFSGAHRERQGLFRQADKGTLFLDEIGELSPEIQRKLLRVLQERRVRPVGSDDSLAVDVRVVCATNRELEREVEEGRFRPDLFARLAEVVVRLPSLRERREDIPLLVAHFLREDDPGGGQAPSRGVSMDALEQLCCHAWPLNVRELRNAVRRAVVLAGGSRTIEPEHLVASLGCDRPDRTARESAADAGPAATAAATAGRDQPAAEDPLAARLREILAQCQGDVAAAAERLGRSRSQAYRLLKQLGIDPRPYRYRGRS